jgi:hypothetical protein
VLLAVLWTQAAWAGPEEGVAALVSNLNRAFAAKDEALARAQFTPEHWSRKRDPGERLYRQGVRKGFELRLSDSQVREGRAVAVVDVLREGKGVDRLFLYAVRDAGAGGGWRIDGLDEDKNHPALFLDGTLPAAFEVEALPGNAELERLGRTYAAAATGDAAALEAVRGTLLDAPGSRALLERVQALGAPVLASTYYAEKLDRAAWVFRSDPEGGKGSTDVLALYLVRLHGRWAVVDSSYGGVSASTFTRARLR